MGRHTRNLDCTDSFIDRWSKRFGPERLARFFRRHAGQIPITLAPAFEARILGWSSNRKSSSGSTHWSTRQLGAPLNVSKMMVARVWRKHAMRPHRNRGEKEIHVIPDNISAHKSQTDEETHIRKIICT